ncbi:MAG: phosphate system positive regulatory protein pho81 [Chaenotheca gracillima]|nr:MAG: phosphate system positive regulatory protein pho81 [Chaenotheca gracillima]
MDNLNALLRSRFVPVLLFSLLVFFVPRCSAASDSLCYFPDGKTVATDYNVCNTTAEFSTCCQRFGSTDSDSCIQSGLCVGGQGYIYRGACTDKTWKDGACTSECTQVNQQDKAPILSCNPTKHAFCCYEEGSDGCCDSQINIPYGLSPSVFKVGANPWTTASATGTGTSTKAVVTATTTITASASAAVSCPKPSPSASTIGAAVGVPLGAALLAALAFIFWMRRRPGNGSTELHGYSGVALDSQPQYGEMYPARDTKITPLSGELEATNADEAHNAYELPQAGMK